MAEIMATPGVTITDSSSLLAVKKASRRFERAHMSENICSAYDNFKSALEEIRKNYKDLNPETGKLYEPEVDIANDVLAAFLRGAVVSVLLVWEFYIYDLLCEGFSDVVRVDSMTSTPEGSTSSSSDSVGGSYKELRKVKRGWPQVIQDAIKRRGEQKKETVGSGGI